MAHELPALPVGLQRFDELRRDNALYIDKTMYLPMLRKTGKVVFCSRPRRFGKSLTIRALDAFYSGRTDLFRGLAAEEHMESPAFTPRPVIRLDMSEPAGSGSKAILEEKLAELLKDNAERHGVSLRGSDSSGAFSFLLRDVHKATGQTAVVLIDEYDAPIIKQLEKDPLVFNELLLAETRDVIRDLYSKIKSADDFIEFAFITGVTKFSGMGLFSLLNNLTDISIRRDFGAFMGYT
ncbi:MAG: AAA family ATPase, partial [Deltaproteobacteria bacterium]|nr:AAA family ATPase [Deltaproteobacteria bacterium]